MTWLSPGDRKLLGKRAADKLEAAGLVLISAVELEQLREMVSRHLDAAGKDAQIGALMRQVIERGEQLSDAKRETREMAAAYLAARRGPCTRCEGREVK